MLLCITISIFLIGVSFLFKRKINDKKVTRRFDDSMSSLSNAKKISMNWWYIYRKRKCEEYVKLNWGGKMEQTNNYYNIYIARMESAWVFNVGLLFLMKSVSKIKHSSFPRHFLRTLKFVLRFIRFKLCFSKKCLPITECLCFSTRWRRWRHVWLRLRKPRGAT